MKDLEDFMHMLCDAAARETLTRFRANTDVTNKLHAEFDPVTEGDREAEKTIRALVQQHYPDHGIIGEEFGALNANAEYVWIIDPIDGTRAFIAGLPVWGTLIGLSRNGAALAGIMHQPFTGERYWAIDGKSWQSRDGEKGRQPLKSRDVNKLAQATMMTTSPKILLGEDAVAYERVEKVCNLARYGCDCYAYAMVAAGHIDLVIEAGLNSYDIAALIPIIEGAGGRVSTWDGGTAINGGRILATGNAELHEEAMALLANS